MGWWPLQNQWTDRVRSFPALAAFGIGFLSLATVLGYGLTTDIYETVQWLRTLLGLLYAAGLIALLFNSDIGHRLLRHPAPQPSCTPFDCLTIAWLGLLPMFWFAGNSSIIEGSDLWFPVRPFDWLAHSVFTWDSRLFAGYPNFLRLPHLILYYFVTGGLDRLGLPLPIVEAVWFVILFSGPGLAMYACASAINRHRSLTFPPLIAALIFMLNPVTVKNWAVGHQLFALADAGWAGVLWMLVLHDAGKLRPSQLGTGAGLISLVMAPAMNNPALMFVVWGSLGALAIGLTAGKMSLKRIWSYSLAVFLILLFNLWWLLPTIILYSSSPLLMRLSPDNGALTFAAGLSNHASFLNVARLIGYSGFWGGIPGEPYVLFAASYVRLLDRVAPLAFVVPVLAIIGVLRAGRDRLVAMLAIQLLVGVALARGFHAPGSAVFYWLYSHVPGFALYRDAFTKFIPLAMSSYSLLAAIGLGGACHWPTFARMPGYDTAQSGKLSLRRLSKLLAPVLLTLCLAWIVLTTWPLFTGDVIRRGGQLLADHRVKIPHDYDLASEALRARGVMGRVLLSPKSGVYVQYTWGYQGAELAPFLVPYPQLSINEGESPAPTTRLIEVAWELLRSGNASDELHRILDLLNVEYILQRDDVDWKLYPTNSPDSMRTILGSLPFVNHIADFDQLHIYQVRSLHGWAPVSTGVPSEVRLSDIVSLDTTPMDSTLSECPTTLLDRQYAPSRVIGEVSIVNPTRYRLSVHSQEPFWLVLKESFHNGWKAYVVSYANNGRGANRTWYDGSALLAWLFERSKRTELTTHCRVDGYANGWHIDDSGSYSVVLEFVPQRYLELGAIISSAALFTCIVIATRKVERYSG